jgi:hypothetical protein
VAPARDRKMRCMQQQQQQQQQRALLNRQMGAKQQVFNPLMISGCKAYTHSCRLKSTCDRTPPLK